MLLGITALGFILSPRNRKQTVSESSQEKINKRVIFLKDNIVNIESQIQHIQDIIEKHPTNESRKIDLVHLQKDINFLKKRYLRIDQNLGKLESKCKLLKVKQYSKKTTKQITMQTIVLQKQMNN